MTNVNDTGMDLGFDVFEWKKSKKNNDTGAGAGANAKAKAKADMMNFVGSDTLAELVWSPQTGLNIKFAENKPCFMWEEGPSETKRLDAQNEQHIASVPTRHDSRAESRSPLKVEPMMQCGPHEQVAIFEKENDRKHVAASHGSVESCRSANLSTKRKKICSFEQQLILGSKRIKKQADEYATKTDHSFMNWISNMLKGFKNHNMYDQRIRVSNETRSLESKETGFQNIFQSLLSPETITCIEKKSIGSSVIAKRCSQESLDYNIKTEQADLLVKQVSLYEGVSKEAPKGMFDTIRGLRLSRTDIHKWMNSKSSVAQLDGFFLRLRVAKPEERAEGSRYNVACITGLQWETQTPVKDMKQSIRVKVGGVECFVESQHISNCDFVEDELIAWWQKTSENQRILVVKDLKSKLAVRRTLGV